MTFTVLFVCTGNVSRSPAAELLCVRTTNRLVRAASAGVAALDGHPIDPPTAQALAALGLDPGAHRARQLSPALVAAADLVLTADGAQRDQVMTDMPAAFRRTFTLKEFARAAADAVHSEGQPERMQDVVVLAARHRRAESTADDDVTDVYGGTTADAQHMVADVRAAVDATARALGVLRPRPGGRPLP